MTEPMIKTDHLSHTYEDEDGNLTGFEVDIATITPEANVKETLMLNSLDVVDMIAIIEFKFGVKIPATELSDIQTFEALYDYVFQNIKK